MLDLQRIAIASGGKVVTPSSEANRKYYEKKLKEFSSDDPKLRANLPEAAALSALVEFSVTKKNYIVHNYRSEEEREPIGEYDVIVVFNVVGEPRFGLLRENDGESAIMVSTKDGNVLFDL